MTTFFPYDGQKSSSRLESQPIVVVAHDPGFVGISGIQQLRPISLAFGTRREGTAEGERGRRHDGPRVIATSSTTRSFFLGAVSWPRSFSSSSSASWASVVVCPLHHHRKISSPAGSEPASDSGGSRLRQIPPWGVRRPQRQQVGFGHGQDFCRHDRLSRIHFPRRSLWSVLGSMGMSQASAIDGAPSGRSAQLGWRPILIPGDAGSWPGEGRPAQLGSRPTTPSAAPGGPGGAGDSAPAVGGMRAAASLTSSSKMPRKDSFIIVAGRSGSSAAGLPRAVEFAAESADLNLLSSRSGPVSRVARFRPPLCVARVPPGWSVRPVRLSQGSTTATAARLRFFH